MDLKLTEKVALVTGSTAGIGLAIAQGLAREGATVYVNGRTQERVEEAISTIKATIPDAKLKGVTADFSKVKEVNALLEEVPEVDILINNVGIFGQKPFAEITDEEWMNYYEVNVLSGVRLSRYYFPKMLAQNWGRIIFLSSESAIQIPEDMIQYGMTKTAMLAISRGLAELTKGTEVTVNAVLPGPTWSEGNEKGVKQTAEKENITVEEAQQEFFKKYRPTSLLQRFATTEEVANLVTYVSSPLSSATNGAALRVDGGVVKSAF
ncbi:SDR family oxidoreductase [Siphonobacter sp. SORGH_AS_0500]|uniref:SDR family NAD(P)-dependent oxidoreductase n=1 Tax=Siphonobacter sp. SORGH_AS_0500 TaxID=1864824 RepID=UPI002855EF8D|nr:SDR family oxidoreductase [Siphonobacter sp. SORGH_AS_0500]MDR6194475.1 NAD(P)-dependent dehydrogenase (short-subunit alcohol dehydrogenase family) [Siphonobacter sp. SORGH_AS_0500]